LEYVSMLRFKIFTRLNLEHYELNTDSIDRHYLHYIVGLFDLTVQNLAPICPDIVDNNFIFSLNFHIENFVIFRLNINNKNMLIL
ncbi:MAG: hypothetical protein PF590_06405, partial [Candidatus Delongbacteria bacterium]|nr:hypothetical protein [Candidatus Delongbacteria bacterium]